MEQATVEFTNDAFLGSGALSYTWYERVDIQESTDSWTLIFWDDSVEPIGETQQQYTVTHADVMRTAQAIAAGRIRAGKECKANCAHMIFGRLDDVDFDADTADQVLQAAAFGEIVYG